MSFDGLSPSSFIASYNGGKVAVIILWIGNVFYLAKLKEVPMLCICPCWKSTVSLRGLHGAEYSPRVIYCEGGDGAHSGLSLTPDLVSISEGECVMN